MPALGEVVEGLRPPRAVHRQAERPGPRGIFGGKERAEPFGIAVLAQGLFQEMAFERRRIAGQGAQMGVPFHGAGKGGTVGRSTPALVVGRDGPGHQRHAAAGEQLHARRPAGRIGQHHVVGHVRRDPPQHRKRRLHVVAGLQHVAQDRRDAEALPGLGPPAISQRQAEPRIVDPVREAPEEFDHPHHRAARPFGAQQQPLVQLRRQVVVPHQPHVAFVRDRGDGAAAEVGRRAPGRQKARGAVRAAREPDEAVVGRHQLRHVPHQRGATIGARRPGVAAARNEPAFVGGPGPGPAGGPFRAGGGFGKGVEGQCHRCHVRRPFRGFRERSGSSPRWRPARRDRCGTRRAARRTRHGPDLRRSSVRPRRCHPHRWTGAG